jgi:two-component system, OmpR family, response regulator
MRILLVEDDPRIAKSVAAAIETAGYVVTRAEDGETAEFLGHTEDFDAVVLDLGLPKMDGLTVLKTWRAAELHMPVLILTARDTWREKVEGIDAGADDYLAKPFETEELLARLRALIRRSAGRSTAVLRFKGVDVDTRSSRVTVNGDPVALSALEYRLLAYLMHHADRVVSRAELTEHIYDQDFERDSNTIEVLVTRLRRKLGVNIIGNRRGLGYHLRDPS